jgi:hydrogenase expression/formation protein HypD
MLRVPGAEKDLLSVKANGGDVRIVYSPLDVLRIAERNPERNVVFFAVGFETTAPANAMAVYEALRRGLKNFSILCSHVLVPPALEVILSAPGNRVQGILAAGHVCTVMGYEEYQPLTTRYRVPVVVTGFEPVDILQGVYMAVRQLESGRAEVENQYSRVVSRFGNTSARRIMEKVFRVVDRKWRGIGEIPDSGYALSYPYETFDAEKIFEVEDVIVPEPAECLAGLVLQGRRKPDSCGMFGSRCTPEHPLGAPMVSSEGACAAYFTYGQRHTVQGRV